MAGGFGLQVLRIQGVRTAIAGVADDATSAARQIALVGRFGVGPSASGDVRSTGTDNVTSEDDSDQKRLQVIADATKRALDEANALAEHISAEVDRLDEKVDSAKRHLEEMADAAGITDSGGAGAAVKALSDNLQDARERLQYLQDTGASDSTIESQTATVKALSQQLDEAEQKLRVAQYEFTHSDAYKKQQQEIAAAEAAAVARKKELDEERAKIEAMQAAAEASAHERAATTIDHVATIEEAGTRLMLRLQFAAKAVGRDAEAAAKTVEAAGDRATTSLQKATEDALNAYEMLAQLADGFGDVNANETFTADGSRRASLSPQFWKSLVDQYVNSIGRYDAAASLTRTQIEQLWQRFGGAISQLYKLIEDAKKTKAKAGQNNFGMPTGSTSQQLPSLTTLVSAGQVRP